MEYDDEVRARHFTKLKEFQERNEAKYNALKDFTGESAQAAAKRDEEIMIKAMEIRDQRETAEI